MTSESYHQLTTTITLEVIIMIGNNTNLTKEQFELKQKCELILNESHYLLTNAQYDEFNRLAALYDS